MSPRVDALHKATGRARYTADVALAGMCHASLVRSAVPHARIAGIDAEDARAMPGVLDVVTAERVPAGTYGRGVRDIPILAREKVRFVGEPVAAVVAETRAQAERAARAVEVRYDDLPAVFDPEEALAPGASSVHDAPWDYPRPTVGPDGPPNLQSHVAEGDATAAGEALAGCAHVVERTYTTPTGHQGYIEPHACVARVSAGTIDVWATDKNPYRLREEVSLALGIDPARLVVHPVALGGDFGGKGDFSGAALCVELARLVGRPVKLAPRYSEDLAAAIPRHPATMRVRLGCSADGRLGALRMDVLCDGGAYAGFKPRPTGDLHGFAEAGSSYRIPTLYATMRIAYTNSLPRGHMRAPGSPQAAFAVESALDELAAATGIDPLEFRRRNLLGDGDVNPYGHRWEEFRGREVLQAAAEAAATRPPAPPGWAVGTGWALYDRATSGRMRTSLRLCEEADGSVLVEVPVPETGTGSHTVVHHAVASRLGLAPERVRIVHVPTSGLPFDLGAGNSRVTVGLMAAIDAAVRQLGADGAPRDVTVEVQQSGAPTVTSVCVQAARVAVDARTGQYRVLEIVTAVDVASVLNPLAHQMQIDGGTAMGYGFACLEDLRVEEGQVWAGTLGSFKLPSTQDVPPLRTVLVTAGKGIGPAGLKAVGELSNVPTAAAIANAVADATGVRVRDLPIRAEQIWDALTGTAAAGRAGAAAVGRAGGGD